MNPCLLKAFPRVRILLAVSVFLLAIGPEAELFAVEPNPSVHPSAPPPTAPRFSRNPTVEEVSRARVFAEPLTPIGREPAAAENSTLAAALLKYAKRSGPDDFSSLTEFLEKHPDSPWRPTLLAALGLEYYNTAHYSLALEAWREAWALAKSSTNDTGKAIGDRAASELAYMYARLGRMNELEALLQSVEDRMFTGSATEKISGAREGLWNMKNRPEISFRCGPLALHRIKAATDPQAAAERVIFESASTQQGLSLPQVAELSRKIGLNYQMAFREKSGAIVIPSVVHWKVGHYAALVRREGDRYLLQDPTFGNDAWATTNALDAETSGYFLIPDGPLPKGWRAVEAKEGEKIWGKGITGNNDPGPHGPSDPQTRGGKPCKGMAVSSVHLMLVNLNLSDEPVGYSPPVGPPVRFLVRYNHRDAFQPATFTYANFGPKWTCDWISYINDSPQNPSANVNYYMPGGGTRTFTGFSPNTQTYAFQQFDQTLLTRTGPASYEMVGRDGSRLIFSQPDGSIGTSRKVFLTRISDPIGNSVTLSYDSDLRLTTITDALGQVTTLTYGDTNRIYRITRVTDPFGRFATFDYDSAGRLTNITDVIGLTSAFAYEGSSDFVNTLITPYGTNTFTRGGLGTTRWLETVYADGSRDRVEFNQSDTLGISGSEPGSKIPRGMATHNQFLYARNTYYWSRNAGAVAYGDYTKARIYHWLHAADLGTCAGILESMKEPLENRVWYNYAGQLNPFTVGANNRPTRIGRVLDNANTQLYIYGYNGFGNVTNIVDPVGRTFAYIYASNGIDLLEVRMTRAGKNELLARMTYNDQHLPVTAVDAAGQTNTFAYNPRGQLLTETNPKGETTSYTYDEDGYLLGVDGPLPGPADVATAAYDAFGRIRTKTDVSGYTLTFDHDELDRITRITFPDATFDQITYQRLEPSILQDRAGRQTLLEYDALGQLSQRTDPLGRVTQFQWCRCGDIKSLTDPMGRTTKWHTDVQGRLTAKEYGDGSVITYAYENATSRLREVVDEKKQRTQFGYKIDNTLRSISYGSAILPAPAVTYTYDPDYKRVTSKTDGVGTTTYEYLPMSAGTLGAGNLASVDGPLPNDTITYVYDELGRRVTTAINGVGSTKTYDAAGRVVSETNSLGSFTRAYDGSSGRLVLETFPNGQTVERSYASVLGDTELQRITHKAGAAPISEFIYGHDPAADRIVTWSQQAGTQPPLVHRFGYDAVNQLVSASITNSGALVNSFAYAYDFVGNRLSEQLGGSNYVATYNALNQLNTSAASGASRTNEWDAKNRLIAVTTGNTRTEFTYEGEHRLHSIRQLTNGVEASHRRFVWCDNGIREERDATGAITTKRFLQQGMKIESGANAGSYFYTRDHLGSVREVTDTDGNVRARYSYDPFGRRTRTAGDIDSDFGFAGLFFASEARLWLAEFRAYDAELGRWLSRDPLHKAEEEEGPNLYVYAANDPINRTDRLGLRASTDCCQDERREMTEFNKNARQWCSGAVKTAVKRCKFAKQEKLTIAEELCTKEVNAAVRDCRSEFKFYAVVERDYFKCMIKSGCDLEPCVSGGGGDGEGGGGIPPPFLPPAPAPQGERCWSYSAVGPVYCSAPGLGIYSKR